MPRLKIGNELQFPNETENPSAPYNGVAIFCKNGKLYTIDSNGAVALIGSGSGSGGNVDLSNYYTINETDNAISTAINALINGAPGTLDTLKELADAVNSNKSLVDALNEAISNKQDTLVSGTNIKTINGESILGSGDITISSSGTENAIPITGSSSLSGTFTPEKDGWANLGSSTNRFNMIYGIGLGSTEAPVTAAVVDDIVVTGNIRPGTSGRVIGRSNAFFGGIYLGDGKSDACGELIPQTLTSGTYPRWILPDATGTIALKTDLNGKQDTLVSGTNIKTINGNSLTGSGNITVNELKGFVSYDDDKYLGTADYAYFAIKPRELPTYDKEKYEAHIGPLNDVSFIRGKLINMNDGTEFDQNYTKEAGNNYWILDIPKKSGTLATLEDIQSSVGGGANIDDSTISTSSTYSSSKIDSTYLKAPDGTVATQEWVNKKITNAYIYKGSVDTYDALPSSADPGFVYNVRSNGANYAWTGTEWDELGATVNLDAYALKTDIPSLTGYATESWVESKNYLTTHQSLDGKQDKLVSGTNIKTINGTSILGSGNITISGGSSGSGSGIQIFEQMPAPEEVSDGQIIAMPTSPGVVDVVYNANASSYSGGVSMTSGNTRTYNSTIGAKNYWMITYTYAGAYTNTLIVPCTGTNFYSFYTNSTSAYLRCSSTTDGKTLTVYNTGQEIFIHAVMAF